MRFGSVALSAPMKPTLLLRLKTPQLVAQPDKVSMMLAQAADRASNALETLAAVEQNGHRKLVPAVGNVPGWCAVR